MASDEVFFLPQRPYMVLGTLRQQLLYPTWSEVEMNTDTDNGKVPKSTALGHQIKLHLQKHLCRSNLKWICGDIEPLLKQYAT